MRRLGSSDVSPANDECEASERNLIYTGCGRMHAAPQPSPDRRCLLRAKAMGPTRDTPEASHCESMVDETIAASIMSILNV